MQQVAGSNHNYRLGEDIMQDRKGGSLCGAVRYVLKGDPRAIATEVACQDQRP